MDFLNFDRFALSVIEDFVKNQQISCSIDKNHPMVFVQHYEKKLLLGGENEQSGSVIFSCQRQGNAFFQVSPRILLSCFLVDVDFTAVRSFDFQNFGFPFFASLGFC